MKMRVSGRAGVQAQRGMMMKRASVMMLLAMGAWGTAAGCQETSKSEQGEVNGGASSGAGGPVFFEGMGAHRWKVTTTSAEAQKYFDQGIAWAYAFNHDEAIRSFVEATKLDPNCAMAWWGIALSNGPHINNPMMDEAHSQAAWEALEKATEVRNGSSAMERALIDALSARYAWPAPAGRTALDRAYADAMRRVWEEYPNNAEVGTLFAESMMDLRPWDFWKADGSPQPGTEEIVGTLEEVLRMSPRHPGANHYYIHTVEASKHPERALGAADRLASLTPGSGHMVHMPAHIYVRTGRWQQAATSNERAIGVDRGYRAISPRQGFYRIYMLHNHHFLAYTAMMEGRKDVAIESARNLVASIPAEFLETSAALADPFTSITYDVEKRFGMWDEILAEPAPAAVLPITTAMWRFNRATAMAAKGQIEEATAEQAEFASAAAAVPAGAMLMINPAHKVLAIAEHMLAGEIAYQRGDLDTAVSELRKGVAAEDQLRYMEPPEWMQPVRHTLGAVLVSAGRFDEAEQVYRDDLARWEENGWSLLGLKQCLEAKGESAEAEAVGKRLERAWARSQIKPSTTCLCVTMNGG